MEVEPLAVGDEEFSPDRFRLEIAIHPEAVETDPERRVLLDQHIRAAPDEQAPGQACILTAEPEHIVEQRIEP